jgi:N-acetylglucosaminyldiphosphoundecaprenol N-acetyl-beta-D-mannosaminyltransferase
MAGELETSMTLSANLPSVEAVDETQPSAGLLPRARLMDVIFGRQPLIGSRMNTSALRGWVSPVEARVHLGIPYGDLAVEEERYLREKFSVKQKSSMLLRAFVSWLLSSRSGLRPERRPKIVSAQVDNITIEEALAAFVAPPPDSRARLVYIVHPHALNLAAFDSKLSEQLTHGDMVLPDGIGIRIAASILGISLRHNLNGTDLLPLICKAASESKLPLVLIGAKTEVVQACAENLMRDTPGLNIPLYHNGYLNDESSRSLAENIRSIGRCIVLVGMGSPLQESWAFKYLADAREATVITVGGLFDFFSGRIPRAPMAWRELGIEWLWRLKQEPRRLAKRYLIGNPLFLLLALKQRVFKS